MTAPSTTAPRVAHVVHSLRTGGLENGLVNLINRMPADRYRHAVICLKDYDRFAERIERDDVPIIALDKKEGQDPALYLRLWKTFRTLRPALVHTRNLAAVEAQLPAWLAGVPARVHGEHGRDMADLAGARRRYRLLRRALRPLIHHFIPLSRDLESYLHDAIGVRAERMTRITNGVDVERFRPNPAARERLLRECGWPADTLIVGWVGRMEAVKNPLGLVEAVSHLCADEATADRVRLVLVGDGSQRREVEGAISAAGLDDRSWLPGSRDDVADLLPAFDLFALPSLAEGISNTVLEALACGVAVVATDVGGNRELVDPGSCGALVPPRDPEALAQALARYLAEPDRVTTHGAAARRKAVGQFSIDAMVAAYTDTYDRVLARHGRGLPADRRLPPETT